MADQNFDVKSFIEKARSQNIPDEQTYKYLQSKGLVPGGTPGASGDLAGTMPSTTVTPPAPSENKGFVKSLVGGASNLFKSLTKPVVQTVAAPFQAVRSAVQYAKDPTKEANVDFTLPYYGKIEAPTSVKQQVGRSLETVSLGLGPVAGGAAQGAGQALEADKSLGETALYAGGGALLGKLGDVAFTKGGQAIQKLANMSSESIAKVIEKSSLPLTAAEKGRLAKELSKGSEFLMNYGVKGNNIERFNKVSAMGDEFEKTLQTFLDENNTKIAPASKSNIVAKLTKLKGKLMKDDPDAAAIERQINDAIDNIMTQYRNEKIPIARLNLLKRNTYANAYNTAGNKVRDDVEHAIGDVYKNEIERATEGLHITGPNGTKQPIGDFNKDYGQLINARKILSVVTNKGQAERTVISKNALRFLAPVVGAGLGYETGGEKGALIGGGLGLLGGKADILTPILEVLAGANTRSQLVGAVKYLEEQLAKSGAEKVLGPTSKAVSKVGEKIKNVPSTMTNVPRTPIEGTPEILPQGVREAIRSRLKVKAPVKVK